MIARRTFVLYLAAAAAAARTLRAEPDSLFASIAKARAQMRTLSGAFTQERTIGLLSQKIVSRGTFALVRPGTLVWELAPPDSVTYWITAESLAYKGRNGQGRLAITEKIAPALDDLRAVVGGDPAILRARYDLAETAGEPGFAAVAKPGRGARYTSISLALDADLVRPKRAILVEGPRDRTEITFGEITRDLTIDPARLHPP